jgi:1-aminocyclopropane-1-carboxylate deaminase
MAGAHSNHLRAFAALSRREQLRAHAIIRGDELRDYTRHSAELRFALDQGVDLSFVSRAAYRELREAVSTADRAALVPDAPWREAVFVPEGGLGAEGVTGVKDWAREGVWV